MCTHAAVAIFKRERGKVKIKAGNKGEKGEKGKL